MRTRLIHPNGAYFDEQAADAVCSFFPDLLVHVKGGLARNKTPLKLDPWQTENIIRPLFGWKREDGWRQYRRLWLEIPRKNAKSTLSSGLGLFLLCADQEPGAECYSAAADKEQARIVFGDAKRMIENSQLLSQKCKIYKDAITFRDGVWRVLSAEAYSKHGFNAHAIIVDEVHAHKNRELIDVLHTATGSRDQPMEIYITTAGYDQNSICWEMHDYAMRICEGVVDDYETLPVIFAAERYDDWRQPATWEKANPGIGKTIRYDYIEAECARALEVPAYENTFKRLHLNMWTEQAERWMPMHLWDDCKVNFDANDLIGADCYMGLDMSSTTDLTALVLAFPLEDGVAVLPFFWAPRLNAEKRARRDNVPYLLWNEQGFLKLTEGNVVDYDVVENDIKQLAIKYNILNLRYDRWNATQIITHLMKPDDELPNYEPLDCIPMGQGFGAMSRPTKELMALVLGGRLFHDGHPVLRWCMANLVVKKDEAENVKPDKEKSNERIDGGVALIMALDGAVLKEQDDGNSIYETQTITVIGSISED